VALVAFMLVQVLPSLAASYQAPKDDWRTTAQHIATSSSPGSYVIAVGDYSDWSVICLAYYFQRFHDPVAIVDGQFVNSDVDNKLVASGATIWGVVVYPSTQQSALLDQPGAEKSDFIDVTGHIHVVRASDLSLSAVEQLKTLLAWEAPVHSEATPT